MVFQVLGGAAIPLAQLELEGQRKTLADVRLCPDARAERDRSALQQAGLLGAHSHCVSVLGATHSGKSFVINKLVGKNVLRVAEPGAIQPTSAGVQCVLTRTNRPSMPLLRLVDYEGAEGADSKPAEQQAEKRSSWDAREGESQRDLWDLRRQATRLRLPRLAYLTTDVLMYVTDADPSRATTLEECAGLVTPNCEPPSLLIVFNKVSPKAYDCRSAEEFSLEVFDAHPFADLTPHKFQAVRLLRLPHLSDAEEDMRRFDDAIRMLNNTLVELLAYRKKMRGKGRTAFYAAAWPFLFDIVGNCIAKNTPLDMTECRHEAVRESKSAHSRWR